MNSRLQFARAISHAAAPFTIDRYQRSRSPEYAPQTYLATVRVVLRDTSMTARTMIAADTLQQAKTMFTRIYGEGNVLTINQVVSEDEEVTEGTKTLSPQELQVKALADKAEDYKQQEKALKARQQMAKAQQNLMKANRGPSAS